MFDAPKKSIRRRVRVILVATSACALALACAAFLAHDSHSFRRAVQERLDALANIVADQVNLAMDVDSNVGTGGILTPVFRDPNVESVSLYRTNGTLFARHVRQGAAPSALPARWDAAPATPPGYFDTVRPVLKESGEAVGTILLRSDLGAVRDRMRSYALIVGAVLAGCCALTLLLSTRLERMITDRLVRLAGLVGAVTRDRNYALRGTPGREDEVGGVIRGINDMLSQIQVRDQALELARQELEIRVEERTAELSRANEQLRASKDLAEAARAELAGRARQQAAVAGLGQKALEGGHLDLTFDEAARLVASTLDVEFVRIVELREGRLVSRASVGWAGADGADEASLSRRGILGGASVPIQGEGESLGVLGVHSRRPLRFGQEEIDFLRLVANTLSAALQGERSAAILRESEERYRRIVELSPEAIVVHTDGCFSFVNASAIKLFGARGPGELLGRDLSERVHPDSREAVLTKVGRLEGQESPLVEVKLLRLDGTALETEIAAMPFVHEGRPAVQLLVRDITRRKEVERLKSEFISVVSHELRTPLTSIQGSLGLVANGVLGALPAAARPLLDIAFKNCQRLVRLINDILDIEKSEAGKMTYALAPRELMPLLRQAVEDNRAFAAGFGVRLVLCREAAGAVVRGDADRLIQVFTNLVSNAAKFSPRGATVEVAAERRNGGLRVSVSDRGSGIPEEFRSRIFQKFSQADSSDIRQKGGTGLGLVICKAIVEKHGGAIDFESAPGRGTTFFVDLPEHAPEPAAVP